MPTALHHAGAAYLGTRPTFDDGAPVLEVFLFDFDGDLYGDEIEVESSTSSAATALRRLAALQAQMDARCERPQDAGPGTAEPAAS